ncbi:MAG: GNAT family N-acetyltransferase, partial [Clostridium sp.]|nr:GNAT family N-acetyltransferase [Clostridium sp.]
MEIIELVEGDMPKALELVLEVFMAYEAPVYLEEGVEMFTKCVKDPEWIGRLKFYGAYKDDEIVGVIATRNNGNHIALFFVKGEYHKQGIGRRLFETVVKNCNGEALTVNSSPYAVGIYEHLGFEKVEEEQVTDGIRYTPMVFRIN